MIDPGFWRGKRVFMTGNTGFKGSWLSQWLLKLGAEVKGYALDPEGDKPLFRAIGLDKEMETVYGDIRNGDCLRTEMAGFRPEIVFHLAAQALVRFSYAEPKLTYETNVMGSLNVYEAVRSCPSVRAVVSITTDKCYENKEWIWGYRENDPMGGYDPYSSSKGCVELLSAAYRNSYFNPAEYDKSHKMALATARAGNVIGGGDWALDRLIPDCMRSLARRETIRIRSPYATRPWQHVLEPLYGYLLLAEKLVDNGCEFSEAWNFGPGDEGVMNVEEVVKRSISSWGSGNYEIAQDADLHEAQLLKLDASKARARLDWKPIFNIDKAISESIGWYKAQSEGLDMKQYTIRSVDAYMGLGSGRPG